MTGLVPRALAFMAVLTALALLVGGDAGITATPMGACHVVLR